MPMDTPFRDTFRPVCERLTDGVSRRALLAITSGGAMAATNPPADSFALACQRWLQLENERLRLLDEWGDREAELFRTHRMTGQSGPRAVSEDRRLATIDQTLEVLGRDQDRLLRRLQSLPADTLAGHAAGLAVVEHLIHPEDDPISHGLVARAVRYLASL